jgi:hypothetical protein
MKYYIAEITVHVNGFEKHIKSLIQADSPENALEQACEDQLHNDAEDGSGWQNEQLIDGNFDFVYEPYQAVEVKPEHVEILKQYL